MAEMDDAGGVDSAEDILNAGDDDVSEQDGSGGGNEEVEDPEDPFNGNIPITRTQGADDESEEGEEESGEGKEDEPDSDDEAEGEEGSEDKDPLAAQIPHYQEIKAKYPQLFKDFPGLKASYFIARDMQAVFGTVEEAKAVATEVGLYQGFERKLLSGDSEGLLTELKRNGKADGFVENFLPTLNNVDQGLYVKVTEPILGNALRQLLAEGTRRGDKNLIAAAKVACNEIFGSYEPPKHERKEVTVSAREKELEEELREERSSKETNFVDAIRTSAGKFLEAEINKVLPKELTAYQRSMLIKAIGDDIQDITRKDETYQGQMRPLWQAARRAGFMGDAKASIVRAFLARSKQSLHSVAKKHIFEFSGKRPVQGSKNTGTSVRRGEGPSGTGKPAGSGVKPLIAKSIDTRKTTAMDILNDKIAFKR